MKQFVATLTLILLSFLSYSQQPNSKYCNKIQMDIDKFEGDTTYRSPHSPGFIDPLYYIKSSGKIAVFIKSWGGRSNVGKKGAILLLKDGSKIERPDAEIDCDVNETQGYLYTTMFFLSDEDLEKLSKSPVSSVRLYIYDSNYNEKRQIKQMEYLRCMRNL